MTIEQQIRVCILQTTPELQTTVFKDEDSLIKTGMVDSQGIVLIVSSIEEKLGVKFRNEDITAENCLSITNLASFVRARLNKS